MYDERGGRVTDPTGWKRGGVYHNGQYIPLNGYHYAVLSLRLYFNRVSDPGGVTPGPGPVPVPQGNRLPVVVASPAPRPADQENTFIQSRTFGNAC